jgi:hypothetical protein
MKAFDPLARKAILQNLRYLRNPGNPAFKPPTPMQQWLARQAFPKNMKQFNYLMNNTGSNFISDRFMTAYKALRAAQTGTDIPRTVYAQALNPGEFGYFSKPVAKLPVGL